MALTNNRAIHIGTLQIPNGQDSSLDQTPIPPLVRQFIPSFEMSGFKTISIATREATLSGVVTVHVLADARLDETLQASYVPLHSPPGTPVTIAPDSAIVLTDLPFPALMLESSIVQAAGPRVFEVHGKRS